MSAASTLNTLRRAGIDLVVAGPNLRFRPSELATPEILDALLEHKTEIIALLKAEESRAANERFAIQTEDLISEDFGAAPWDAIQASQITGQTIVDISAQYPATGFDAGEFHSFDAMLVDAYEARDLRAVRTACRLYRRIVNQRINTLQRARLDR